MNHFYFSWQTLISDFVIGYSAFQLGWIFSKRKYTKITDKPKEYDLRAEDKAYKLLTKS